MSYYNLCKSRLAEQDSIIELLNEVRLNGDTLIQNCQERLSLQQGQLAAQGKRFSTYKALDSLSQAKIGLLSRSLSETHDSKKELDQALQQLNSDYLAAVAEAKRPWYLSLIHISEPTRHAQISYAVFCLKKKN